MENFAKIIGAIKEQLTDSNSQFRNKTISNLLETLRTNQGEQFVMQLIYNGVISDLIQNVDRTNRRDLLECIEIMVKSNAFYTSGLVDETIKGITMHRSIDSIEEAAIAVNIILTIVTKVFAESTESQVILLINKHEEGLLNFLELGIFDSFSMLSAVKLLNFLIKYSTKSFKQTRISSIRLVYKSTMKFLVKAEGVSDLEKLENICSTSISLANLCNESDEEKLDEKLSNSSGATSVFEIPKIKESLIELIRLVAIKDVIPLAKGLKIEIETAYTFVEFLETVIKLRVIKDKALCIELLSQGYLKYLLELSLLNPERPSFRFKVCRLISEIIVTVKDYLELPINDWQGGSVAFQNFICIGLESLPVDFSQWEDLLKAYDCKSNSLLILVFCHFIGTEEKYIFTQKSLAVKITSVVEECIEPVFLRALWLLYSVATLASRTSESNSCLHTKAIKKFATSLQNQNSIELAYTHNVDLLFYSMKETGFPEKLRIKVISLWLENSSSNKEFDIFIQECLVQCYEELKIVQLLMTIVHEKYKTNLNNTLNAYESLLRFKEIIPGDVVEYVWKTLSEDLASYTSTNILKTVLRIIGTLPTSESVSASLIRKCAKGIPKVLNREDIDMILKSLLITAAAFAIRQSAELNDSKVTEIFLENDKFLKEVYDSGLSFKETRLTEMCVRTLASIIACQITYNLQCKTISQLTFKELETLLLNLREQKCSTIFGVEFVKFLIRNKVKNPVIGLRRLENNCDLEHIYNVYFLIHTIHAETLPGKEDQTYQCLSTILNYGSDQKLNMGVFLTCSSTPLLTELAIKGLSMSTRISYYFLDFATTWLGYLKVYRSENEIQIKGLPEKSVELLVQFLPLVMDLSDVDSVVVHNFLTAVSYYMKKS